MPEYLGKLLVDKDDISKSLRLRKKTYIEKTITGKNLEIAKQKALLEEEDGWTILRKNKKSFCVKKDKPLSEQLEDEIWSIVACMGFNELSNGRDFKIDVKDTINPRQIDVFAKDRESAIMIECTCCEEAKKMSLFIPYNNSVEKAA